MHTNCEIFLFDLYLYIKLSSRHLERTKLGFSLTIPWELRIRLRLEIKSEEAVAINILIKKEECIFYYFKTKLKAILFAWYLIKIIYYMK